MSYMKEIKLKQFNKCIKKNLYAMKYIEYLYSSYTTIKVIKYKNSVSYFPSFRLNFITKVVHFFSQEVLLSYNKL